MGSLPDTDVAAPATSRALIFSAVLACMGRRILIPVVNFNEGVSLGSRGACYN